jgi:hypothetical protein
MKLKKIRAGLYRASIGDEEITFEKSIVGENCYEGWSGFWCARWGDYDHRNTWYVFRSRAEAVRYVLKAQGAQS